MNEHLGIAMMRVQGKIGDESSLCYNIGKHVRTCSYLAKYLTKTFHWLWGQLAAQYIPGPLL